MKNLNIFTILLLVVTGLTNCEIEENNQNPIHPINGKTTTVFNVNLNYGSMTDQDSNVYKTITIGTQTWMAENLRTTLYSDGVPIPEVTGDSTWTALKTGAYCNYNNTLNAETIVTYGRLYNWYAVNTGALAPKGWRVPTDDDWIQLTNYLGGECVAGNKMKEIGIAHWVAPNSDATNESGFTALPAGYRAETFRDFGYTGSYWSSNHIDFVWLNFAWCRTISFNTNCFRDNIFMEFGYSVRLIKDERFN